MYYTYSLFYISEDTVHSDNFLGITDRVLTQKLPSAVVTVRSLETSETSGYGSACRWRTLLVKCRLTEGLNWMFFRSSFGIGA